MIDTRNERLPPIPTPKQIARDVDNAAWERFLAPSVAAAIVRWWHVPVAAVCGGVVGLLIATAIR